jgi:hypothetical protein
MKARLLFYCAALVALVLILAAVPSHATERRDPPIIQDTQQTQGAKASGSAHSVSGTKAANASHKKSSRAGTKKDSPAPAKNTSSKQNGMGSSTAAK